MKNLITCGVLCLCLMTLNAAATTYYVDINSTNPTPPYTNWSIAATNIQDAVDAAAAGDTVLVTDGVYQAGGQVVYGTSLNRVAITKPITVESVNGPAATTIRGYYYPYPANGVRCAYLTNDAMLAGFTLTQGDIDAVNGGSSDVYDIRGGGVYAEADGIVSNCVISGNVVYGSSGTNNAEGGGMYGGAAVDCTISGNHTIVLFNSIVYGGGASFSSLTNCVISENSSTIGGGVHACALDNCSVINNSAQDGGGVADCAANNSIVYFNTGEATNGSPNYIGTTFSYSCTTPDPGGAANITNDPDFVNSPNGDYNLQLGSPCINAGNNACVGTATDLNGNPRIVAGIVDMGAYEYQSLTIEITAQPATQTNILAETTTLSVDALSVYPLTYQWFFDSSSISGATNSNLVISNLQLTNAGAYFVAISNPVITTDSAPAILSVFYPPPAIVQQPASVAVILGSNTILSVTSTSYLNMTFQWQLNGTNLIDQGEFYGSTSSNLLVSGAEPADAGNYDVIVSDSQWSVTSAVATVSVFLPAVITLQPTNETAIVPNNVSISAAASGTGPLGFQWFFNGTPLTDGGNISGSGSSTLNISGVQLTNAGVYQVLATNSFSEALSATSTLTVLAHAQILSEPTNEAVVIGNAATISVIATGTGLGYQWYFNGAPLSDGNGIAGSGSANLVITDVQSANGGNYQVIVSNMLNTVASTIATLTPQTNPGPSIRYVNVSNSAPASPYVTWSTAATNIQTAIDASIDGDQIVVTDGVYQVGGESIDGWVSNRIVINKAVSVESVNGPSNTTIEGYHPALPQDYRQAMRCVYMISNSSLVGFTVAGGAAEETGDALRDESGGGVWCESTNSILISNCVITANLAYYEGGGVYQGTLVHCTVLENQAVNGGGGGVAGSLVSQSLVVSNTASTAGSGEGGGAYNSTVFSSAFIGNSALEGGGAYGGSVVNCTIIGNSALASGGGIESSAATNSIIYYNRIFSNQIAWTNYVSSSLSYCCATAYLPPPPGNITNDPALADFSHISLNSPCRGAGNPLVNCGVDIDGNPWNSPPSIGCSEIPSSGDYGNLAVRILTPLTNWAPGFPMPYQALVSGPDYMTVWNFGDGTLITNGLFISHTWSAPGSYPVTLTAYNDSYPTGVTASLTINVAVPAVSYVNLANPNPMPPYSDWSIAATNIEDAVAVAAPGSLVLVTNPAVLVIGIENQAYTNITAIYQYGGTNNLPLPGPTFARVAISRPITVQSVNGPAVTYIAGGLSPGGIPMRCVSMTNGAVLSGFTITNGFANGAPQPNAEGGGIWAASTNCVITNCIITRCRAVFAGGAVYSGTLYNCSIKNSILSNAGITGAGVDMSVLNNCILYGNSNSRCYGAAAANSILNGCTLTNNSAGGGAGGGALNCTLSNCILTGNSAAEGAAAFGGVLNSCLMISNSAFSEGGAAFGGSIPGQANYPIVLDNCILSNNVASSGGGAYGTTAPNFTNCILNNCFLAFNDGTNFGGAAYAAQMNNCVISNNSASPAAGGWGGGTEGGLLNNCLIIGNQAYNSGGADANHVNATLNNCTLANNTAVSVAGGAGNAYGTCVLDQCILSNNAAGAEGGGALGCVLSQCTIVGNVVTNEGGGVALSVLNDCLIISNTAVAPPGQYQSAYGGGAYSCELTNCILAYNVSMTNGGAAYQSTLVNCTIVGNVAHFIGGAMDCLSFNCILYYNVDGDYYPDTTQYPLYNCCAPVSPFNGLRNITTPPLFVNLASGDYHLQSSSPCINSGNNAYVTAATDLDGNPRIVGGTVDIGAYEYQTPTSVISYAYLQQYGLPTDGSVDFKDLDGTTFNVYQDWIAGLNPTNPASILAMLTPVTTNTETGVTVTWQSVSGIPYFLQRSTNLASQPPFSMIQNNIVGQTNTTSYADTSATNGVPYFYRVGVIAP